MTPWEHSPQVFATEVDFNNWFRDQINKIAMDSPIKDAYKKKMRFRGLNSKDMQSWRWNCKCCSKEVGEIYCVRKERVRPLKFDDLSAWFSEYLCSEEDLLLLCNICKKNYQHAKAHGITMAEASIRNQVNVWLNNSLDSQMKFLKAKGFTDLGNRKKRKLAYTKVLVENRPLTFTEIVHE